MCTALLGRCVCTALLTHSNASMHRGWPMQHCTSEGTTLCISEGSGICSGGSDRGHMYIYVLEYGM